MSDFAPTPEQEAALVAFATRDDLVIEAAAGAGKTSTLVLLAKSDTRRGQYIAYNKAAATDAQARFPAHFAASTAHSLAFRAVGHRYKHRLQAPRIRGEAIARILGIDPITVPHLAGPRVMSPEQLAGRVMGAVANFCNSDDREPGVQHFSYIEGIDAPTKDGKRTFTNNDQIRNYLLPALERAWDDLASVNGQLPYQHDCYLKSWALTNPVLPVDVVLLDEAQDTNPVLAAVFAAQSQWGAQLVAVGDANQQIYSWRGAIDAMARMRGRRTMLTQSFRFGDAVAEVANRVLETLPTDMRVRGWDQINSVVGPVAEPDAILCRTNGAAVGHLLGAQTAGRSAHLVGGASDILRFARAVEELQATGRTWHPDLACFQGWAEVQDYVKADAQGEDLKVLVNLVDQFGAARIAAALGRMPREEDADLVISTAHKSKGREWPTVVLGSDFPEDPKQASEEERRLLYVAVTRARVELDADAVSWLVDAGTAAADDDQASPLAVEAVAA